MSCAVKDHAECLNRVGATAQFLANRNLLANLSVPSGPENKRYIDCKPLRSTLSQLRRFRLTRGRESVARHYSTREFFRQMPNALLARYFQARGLFGDLDFSAMKETQPDELFAAWLHLPDDQRNEMDAEFRDIFELSCEKGFRAIIDEAEWHLTGDPDARTGFVENLAALSNHYERAMVTFLDHNQFWKGANPVLSRGHAALLAQTQESAAPTGGS
jgi:hypothetical protein